MKPRNNREKEVLALSRELPDLSDAKKAWIRNKVVKKHIYTSGLACWCSDCGHSWKEKIEGEVARCPNCGAEGSVVRGRMQTGSGLEYAQFLQTYHGYQVIRYTLVEWYYKKGRERRIYFRDVLQKWCQPGRPTITLGVALSCYPWSCRIPYSMYGMLQVKDGEREYYKEWMNVVVYPKPTLLPVYRKNVGAKPDLSAFDASQLLGNIFSCPYLESLWKAKEFGKLKTLIRYTSDFNKYWPSVKVALRHGYEPDHWISYFDYLKMLRFLHYDMRSPRYVAPPDWREIHERIMTQYGNRCELMQRRREETERLRRAQEEEERMQREAERAKRANRSFGQRIRRFAALVIADENLVIKPLMSIQEFMEEGRAMHHCVFTNAYYNKPDSLILSARKKDSGERVETIEVNLSGYTIWQSRGINNCTTAYHNNIERLVYDAMPRIKEMSKPKKKAVSASRS